MTGHRRDRMREAGRHHGVTDRWGDAAVAVGIARVAYPRPDSDHLTARMTALRYIDGARLAARTTEPHRLSLTQARRDIETLGGTLADLLFMHEPRDGSPLCPGCSEPGCPRLWPCRTWRRIMARFGAEP